MNCPYSDCTRKSLDGTEERCPQCSRPFKRCPHCKEPNRVFANYCRACGQEMAGEDLDWTGLKGGSERSGLNPFDKGGSVRDAEEIHPPYDLEDPCRSLLASDNHLIAVSRSGRIEVFEVRGEDKKPPVQWVGGFRAEGPMTCEPCVYRGSLYVGSRQRIAAYTLDALSRRGGQVEARWEASIEGGTPIQGLLAFAERLYVNVGYRDRRPSEIRIIDGIQGRRCPDAQLVHRSSHLSTPAGGPRSQQRVFFLSEDNGQVMLHRADHSGHRPVVTKRPLANAPRGLRYHVPIAAMGKKVFAVFGDDSPRLYSIDTERGTFGSPIRDDVQNFALSSASDGVLIRSSAVHFLHRNRQEPLTPDDRISGPPLIVKNRAAFVGMKDGRIRWYDLSNPSLIGERHLSDASEEITALASFRNYIAAGGSRGTVRIYRLAEKR